MAKITTGAKQAGDIMSAQMYNDIIYTINTNADILTEAGQSITALGSQMSAAVSRIGVLEGAGGVIVSQTLQTAEVSPGVLNVWSVPQTSLAVTFVAVTGNKLAEYMLQFTVSGSSFTLTLPSGVRWADEPEWESGWTYQVSIENGLAIGYGWPPA